MKIALRKYPKLIEAMEMRHEMYNETIGYICEKEKNGEILVIRPEGDLPVGRTEKDPEKLREAYEIGRKQAQEKLEKIKEFLGK